MFTELSEAQRGLIKYYIEHAKLAFLGLDVNDLPVFMMQDKRRVTEPFAIPRSTGRYGAVEPAMPLRWFSEEEQEVVNVDDHELLTLLPRVLP